LFDNKTKKIGHTDLVSGSTSTYDARMIAKAYFSKPPLFTGTYEERQKQADSDSPYAVAWTGGSRVGLVYRNDLSKMWYVCDCDIYFEGMQMEASSMVILEPSSIDPREASMDDLRAIITKYDMNTGKLFKQ
jgi:hypothetical protein